MKLAALAWLLVLAVACAMLVVESRQGAQLQTDMTALLPLEERDAAIRLAKNRVTELLQNRVFLLAGDPDRAAARAAGAALAKALADSGLTNAVTYRIAPDRLKSLGEMYFPFRSGLLSAADRDRLERQQGGDIVNRAMANIYGPAPIVDAALLRNDPFLLLAEFLNSLPVPFMRLTPDDGVLSVRRQGITWVLLVAEVKGNIYSGEFQDRFSATLNGAERALRSAIPQLRLLRVGAIFYAQTGARTATSEVERLTFVSIAGTVLLILGVFQALRPLFLTILAIATGVLCAFAVCLSIFGGIHVAALLVGISLNGIAIDYCLQYVSARFAPDAPTPIDRLRYVLPGITLGAATTLIGYGTLMLAPFPGLFQLAVFSSVGLLASFITIVVWLPMLDTYRPLAAGVRVLAIANLYWRFWEEHRHRPWRWSGVALIAIAAVTGGARLRVDDDIRHQQALSESLRVQESEVRTLTGVSGDTQFLLVQGPDRDRVLQTEEVLQGRLASAQEDGALRGFQSVSQFIPSIARQRENRALVQDKLNTPYLEGYCKRVGINGVAQATGAGYLTPDAIGKDSPLAFLRNLTLESNAGEASNLIILTGVSRPGEIKTIAQAVPGVRFVDPTGDVTRLLAEYRERAIVLMVVSVFLMTPILLWRYGIRGTVRVILPPAIAVVVAPALAALAGISFTFFGAMALVLVLSIGFDYSVFCREAKPSGRGATMLGIWLAMLAAMLSFGLLVFSSTYAIHAFGATILVGTALACLFAPLAANPRASS